jgi:hypothetical protein
MRRRILPRAVVKNIWGPKGQKKCVQLEAMRVEIERSVGLGLLAITVEETNAKLHVLV